MKEILIITVILLAIYCWTSKAAPPGNHLNGNLETFDLTENKDVSYPKKKNLGSFGPEDKFDFIFTNYGVKRPRNKDRMRQPENLNEKHESDEDKTIFDAAIDMADQIFKDVEDVMNDADLVKKFKETQTLELMPKSMIINDQMKDADIVKLKDTPKLKLKPKSSIAKVQMNPSDQDMVREVMMSKQVPRNLAKVSIQLSKIVESMNLVWITILLMAVSIAVLAIFMIMIYTHARLEQKDVEKMQCPIVEKMKCPVVEKMKYPVDEEKMKYPFVETFGVAV